MRIVNYFVAPADDESVHLFNLLLFSLDVSAEQLNEESLFIFNKNPLPNSIDTAERHLGWFLQFTINSGLYISNDTKVFPRNRQYFQ